MVMVFFSAKAQGFQVAYQIGAMVVLPVVMLVLEQAFGVKYFSVGLVLALGLSLWVLDALLLWLVVRSFHRDQLISWVGRKQSTLQF